MHEFCAILPGRLPIVIGFAKYDTGMNFLAKSKNKSLYEEILTMPSTVLGEP